MIVFLDESGDAGFKLGQGSSTYFVIALVIFDSFDDAEATAKVIQGLRGSLKLHSHFEFKFNKMSDQLVDHLRTVHARAFYSNATITMVVIGA